MAQLVNYKKFPPKGYVYREVIAGKSWTNPHAMEGLDASAKALFNVRTINKIKTSLEQCTQDIVDYTCKRLDNDTRWCVGPAVAQVMGNAQTQGCAGCGKKRKQ